MSRNEFNEFEEFKKSDSFTPPVASTEGILSKVHADLNPRVWTVFLKLAVIHAIVGGITLLFCPQFSVNPLGGMGLMSLLMKYGEQACMLGCGSVFMGGSLLVASLVLRPEEVRTIRRTEILQLGLLALLSIGAFICADSSIVGVLALFWMLGSILGGLGTFELGWALRRRLYYRV